MKLLALTLLAGLPALLCAPTVGILPRDAPPNPARSFASMVREPADTQETRRAYAGGPVADIALPGGAHRRISSLLSVPGHMGYGDYVWRDPSAPGPLWIVIDPKRQLLSVFRNGDEIGSTVILYGMRAKPTPAGAFPILAKAEHHRSSLYEAEMPYMLRLTGDGISIHAANVREAAATHGCVGVPAGFAKLLFAQAGVGDMVYILGPSTPPHAVTQSRAS